MEQKAENRTCQNCKKDFTIEPDDFNFYEKIKVPAPTFCPECRYRRRNIWRNVRHLFRNVDALTNKEIFSSVSPESGLKVYELSYWLSDSWDPLEYGRDFDFSISFFQQFYEFFKSVPFPSMDKQRCINSDYSDMCDDMKNTYLCFNATFVEDSAYCTGASKLKNCFDLSTCYEDELCYESVRVDKSYNVVGSVMLDNCVDIYFSKNCVGCSNCLGCVNLINSSYMIFNEQYSKEEYFEKLKSFKLDTWKGFVSILKKSEDFWRKFPVKYMLGFRNYDVSGENIKDSKNVKYSYIVKKGENLKYVQDVPFGNTSNSYDFSSWGLNASQIYECMICGENVDSLKFCYLSYPNSRELEYCMNTRRCKNCFACVGLKDGQYCILNKQYTKEEYFTLVEKIKKHMNEMPFIDKRGNIYKYGEFLPFEFSPFAYNETLIYDQFPLSKEKAESLGYVWREPNKKDYETTVDALELPEFIQQSDKSVTKEIIKCLDCKRAYRIMPNEFDFLKNKNLPLPRMCVDCRFLRRQRFIAPPSFKELECMCAGSDSADKIYKNNKEHNHGTDKCKNTFVTSYNPEKEIIYCESCYQQEVY